MMTKQAELKQKAYQSGLKSRALSILIYLIDRSNKDLTCFPAIPTMAEQLHISVSTVKRSLHELVDAGFIKKETRFREKNRGQTSNLYTLVQPENAPAPTHTPENNNDKRSATEPQATEKQGCEVQHITFAEIAACEQEQAETLMKTEVVAAVSETVMSGSVRTPILANCLPIQIPFTRPMDFEVSYIQSDKKAESKWLCFFYPCWTGVEVNLHPP